MGNGIAHVFAQAGFKVTLIDLKLENIEAALKTINKNLDRQIAKGIISEDDKKNTIANINSTQDIKQGVKDSTLVIEAATENFDLKLKIFRQLDEFAPLGCILATNTSSISITKIAAATIRPQDVIGMHFMNPVPVMKLVEIINGYATKK